MSEKEYCYEIFVDDECLAGGTADDPEFILSDANYMLLMYSEEGDATVKYFVKNQITEKEMQQFSEQEMK